MTIAAVRKETSQLNWPMIVFWPIMFAVAGLGVWRIVDKVAQGQPGIWTWAAVMAGVSLGLGLFTGFGISVGYHRGFTHKGFETRRWITGALLVGGGMTMEGDAKTWIETHMAHHVNADEWDDPHSPYRYAKTRLVTLPSGQQVEEDYVTRWGLAKGLFWAHLGWLFVKRDLPPGPKLPESLQDDRMFTLQQKYYWVLLVATFAVPTMIGAVYGLLTGNVAMGALDGFLIPGMLRLMIFLNFTWSINSVCHVWGGRAKDSVGNSWMADNARNVWILGLPTLGESLHSNHHADPKCAYHGVNKGDLDPSKWLLIALEKVKLVSAVRKPRKGVVFNDRQLTKPRLTRPSE